MKKRIGVIIFLVISIAVIGFVCFESGKGSNNTNNIISEKKNAVEKIAVVNLDEGTGLEGEQKIYYGEKVVQFPNEFFLYTSLEDARQGIENGTYAAYIIIPASFSNSINSLNATPSPATLQYALNNELDGEIQTDTLYQVMSFGESLNTDLSYMYLANVLQEFHQAQDETTQVMSNDLKDKDAIDKIQASDLVQMVKEPELVREANTTTLLNTAPYMEMNSGLVTNIDENYKTNIEDSQTQLSFIQEKGTVLGTAMEELSGNVGEINLTTDENGTNLYEGGLTTLTQTLAGYNEKLTNTKSSTTTGMDTLENQRADIVKQLTKSMSAYNELLEKETAGYLSSYKEQLGAAVPGVTCTKVKDSQELKFQISCEAVEGKDIPPVVTLTVVMSESEENVRKTECLKALLEKVMAASLETEVVDVEITQTGVDDQEITLTGTQDVSKSVKKVLEECDMDTKLMEMMQACGYSSAFAMLDDFSEGNLSMESTTAHIVVDGDISAIDQYIQDAFSTVDSSIYISTPFTGSVNEHIGDKVTISALLDQYETLIKNAKDGVSSITMLDSDNVTDTVNNGCILPLVNKTESVKQTFQQRYTDETIHIKDYKTVLDGYHPLLDTSKITGYVAEMNTNGSKLQQDVTENNQSYAEFANKVYTTTQENTITLQTHIQEAKGASNNAVASGLSDAKSIKATTSGENQQAMAEFAEKLPYTRLGSMEYTQAYEFIANPLLVSEVSDYQRLKDDVSLTANKASSGNQTVQSNRSQRYVQWILYAALVLLIVASIMAYLVRTKRVRNRSPHYLGN
ncbi:MAG: hypothetical protein RR681_07865 [Lachnospiraceae bacterium]